jgi:hypothetical protein
MVAKEIVAKIGTAVETPVTPVSFDPSRSNSSAHTEHFTNAMPKYTDYRRMPIEMGSATDLDTLAERT